MNGTKTWVVLFLSVASTSEFRLNDSHYHSFVEMTAYLRHMNGSNVTNLYSIGQSIQGRELWVMEIFGSKNDELLRPNVKLVANVHGTEAVGRELSLQFIQYLVDGYGNDDAVTDLLDYANVHVLPSINPDGFELILKLYNAGHRFIPSEDKGWDNHKYRDLNLDFPIAGDRRDLKDYAPESLAVMRWMEATPFVLSLSLKGSGLVATYPYHTKIDGDSKTTENNVFEYLARLYSDGNPSLKGGCGGREGRTFPNGVVHGADWWDVKDTMQDYNYRVHGCLELTVEISCERFPHASTLPSYWDDNRKAIVAFLKQVQKGIRGVVRDEDGAAVPNATVTIDHYTSFRATPRGEYWRVLLVESVTKYNVKVDADGFQRWEDTINLDKYNSTRPKMVNVTLRRVGVASTKHQKMMMNWSTAAVTSVEANPQSSVDNNINNNHSYLRSWDSWILIALGSVALLTVVVGILVVLIEADSSNCHCIRKPPQLRVYYSS